MSNVSKWPAIYVRVDPGIYRVVNALAEARALPASVIVREALNKAFRDSYQQEGK